MFRTLTILAFTIMFTSAASAVEVGDDGLHKQEWFTVTFRDLTEDIESARAEGKRLALFFEQRGCIYCKIVHEEVLTDPEVSEFIKANYMVVQYNLYGDEEMVDTDGEELTEKTAARKWGVMFTPTVVVAVSPSLSVTCNPTVNTPAAAELNVALMPGVS